ncbi:hypothetical protein BKA70DRAFT_1557179 [Coprinopsis sp. MPI-PUGE-AT-0042]|nr:hypothetical protein BKA70DRAFT_1557179 [Coprinopsis sp. MPI-PUGE-AT-0042]
MEAPYYLYDQGLQDDDDEYAPPAPARRGRRRRDLSLLPEVPMDVLFEILLYLEPKDLLTMSRANKGFRRALINETMNRVVWKVKRIDSGAPEPPPKYTEAKWVAFLFSNYCKACATPNVVTDFFILKRLCVACKKENYLEEDDANPDYAVLLGTFVPMTCYAPSSSKEYSDGRYCYTPDFEKAIDIWSYFLDLINASNEDAEEALYEVQQEQSELVQWIDKMAPECYGWVEAIQEQRQLDKVSINEQRAEAIRLRFYELGYAEVDVDEVVTSDTPEVCGKVPNITNRVWTNIRNKLEPSVIHVRDARLYGITANMKLDRLHLLVPAYCNWIASLNVPTAEDMTYPVLRELAVYPIISNVLEAAPEVQVTEEDFRPAIAQFAHITASFLDEKKDLLREMIPATNTSAATTDSLELATSIFKAPPHTEPELPFSYLNPQYVVGWKMHSILHGYDWDPEGEELGYEVAVPAFGTFDPKLSEVAAFLVELCGRNRFTTTIQDMDRMNQRFGCRKCMDDQVRRRHGHDVDLNGHIRPTRLMVDALSWRAALGHLLSHPYCDEPRPFRLLDADCEQDATEQVRDRVAHETASLEAWFCNHCPGPSPGKSVKRSQVLNHLVTEHGLRRPRAPVDYFMNEAYRLKSEMPLWVAVTFSRGPVESYRPLP